MPYAADVGAAVAAGAELDCLSARELLAHYTARFSVYLLYWSKTYKQKYKKSANSDAACCMASSLHRQVLNLLALLVQTYYKRD